MDPSRRTDGAMRRFMPAVGVIVGLVACIAVPMMYLSSAGYQPDTVAAPVPSTGSAVVPTFATVDRASPSSLIVGPAAVGPLRVGEDSTRLITEQALVPTGRLSCATDYASDVPSPVRVSIGDHRGSVSYVDVTAIDGPLSRPADSPRTVEGIGLQSTEEHLLAAYPDAIRSFEMQTMLGAPVVEYVIGPRQGAYLHFAVTDGVVNELRLNGSADPFLEDPTGC